MVPTNAGEGGPGTPGVYGQVTAALVEQEQHQEETPRKKYGMSFLCPFNAIRFFDYHATICNCFCCIGQYDNSFQLFHKEIFCA